MNGEDFYKTPRELELEQDIKQARAKLRYVCQMAGIEPETLTPIAATMEIEQRIHEHASMLTVVPVVGIYGNLGAGDNLHVIAYAKSDREVRVEYMVEKGQLIDMRYLLNRVMPEMHIRFLRHLGEAMRK